MHLAKRGMTLIDVIVGTAIVLIIFLAIFGLLRASAQISTLAAETAAATAIANSQMEYIRSLPYDSIGTIGGIPAGAIAQSTTTIEDNVPYSVRTFIDYYDDPADGTGGSDTNGITTDYKRAKVTVSFTATTGTKQLTLVSNFAPPGIETTTGGGTLKINVVNASGTAVAGASVHITNASTSPTVDVTTFTDSTGIVYLPGAATSTSYHVTVTKSGYSTAQTYDRNTNNQNPTPGHLTVVKNVTTSATFAIDQLATFTMTTFSPIVPGSFADNFNDATKVASLSNVTIGGGIASLTVNGSGGYLSPGSIQSTTTAPAYLSTWVAASTTLSTPPGTAAVVHVTDRSGNLLPDSVLPGNSAGFSTFPIDLSRIATSTYPALGLVANLSGGAATPSVDGWGISYTAGPIPLPNVSFTLTGAKTIGSTGSGAPIYKTVVATTTDATGTRILTLEWDAYSLAVSGHTVATSTPSTPYQVFPASSSTAAVILSP